MSNIGKIIRLLIFVLVFICNGQLRADTVYLKNGRSIEGLIKSEDENSIELEVSSAGAVKFEKNQIEKIERSGLQESIGIRQKWESQKIETQEKLSRQQLEEERKPRKVEFSPGSQGIILDVILNQSTKTSLVLDTGASLVVLKKDIAKKLGIDLDKVKTDVKLTVADGRQVNAKYVILENVEVEGVEEKNVEAAIMLDEAENLDFGDGLLGMSFLKRFNFKVDQKEKKLTLEKL